MIDRPGPTLTVYNPDLLSDADLKRQFVARLGLLERLIDDLRGEGASQQHHLILGQRGMGKTTLLRRLRGAIQEDEALRQRWLPLSFPEEQYNVSRLSDLWVNCLDALGDALERNGDKAGAAAIDALVDSLPEPEEARGRAALDGLVSWSEAHRGLVLMIDNVDLLFNRLEAQQWAIREVMSEHRHLVWIVASAEPLESTAEYGSAFYDFFAIHELRGLDYEESRQMVLRLAQVHNTPQVSRVLEDSPGRFRALHVLTGGNPRTLVLLYQVFAHDDASSVHVDLERLLDMCTPLYKARFESLSAQAQQLTDALAIGWDPMTAADVATATRLEINLVSAQLNRLVTMGVVEKVPLPAGSKSGFQIGERFFNIWYLMRASRRVRRRLEWLVRFLEVYYGPQGLKDRAERLLNLEEEALARRFITEGDDGLHARCWPEVVIFFREAVRTGHAPEALQLLDETGQGERWRPLREAVAAVAAGDPEQLLAVAPEVRVPASAILEELWPLEERPAPKKRRRP